MSIDVLMVHGITKSIHQDQYYSGFVNSIRRYLPIDADVVFHGIDYSTLLEDRENEIFSWMKDMGHGKIRRFACDYACDVLALAYPKREARPGDFIYDLTNTLSKKFDEVCKKRPESRKVILGHSLGSIIGYGFTWDRKVDALITMGSPFLYFSVRYAKGGEMNPNLSLWVNYFKHADPVSTICSRNPRFKDKVTDIEVKSWNPIYLLSTSGLLGLGAGIKAHTDGYWKSDFLHKDIAKRLNCLNLKS